MPPEAFVVSAPATSANLGPGFDAVGAALSLRLRAQVTPARRFSLAFEGPERPTHDGYARLFREALGFGDRRMPNAAIRVRNAIPLGKGLGSSAAARVAALAIAQRFNGEPLDRAALARDATRLEGHADNAHAAVYGGIAVAANDTTIVLPSPHDVRAVVVVPEIDFETHTARAVLPQRYSLEDTAFTAARASLLGAALASASWHALAEAMRDRMHQPYRAKAVPGLDAIVALRLPGLLGIALSGAGPSVLAIVRERSAARVATAIRRCFAREGVAASAMALEFSARGLTVAKSPW